MNVPLMLFITEFKKEPSENILCLLEIMHRKHLVSKVLHGGNIINSD